MTAASPTLVACLAALVASGCTRNIAPLEELDAPGSGAPFGMPGGQPPAMPPGGARAGGPPPASPAPAWSVSGTVSLAAALVEHVPPDAVLFVFARVPGQRMPVAVQRFPAPRFPVAFTLQAGHAGEPEGAAPAQLEVVARVSRGGMAGPPQAGDLEGQASGPCPPGATGVTVTVDTAR